MATPADASVRQFRTIRAAEIVKTFDDKRRTVREAKAHFALRQPPQDDLQRIMQFLLRYAKIRAHYQLR